MLANPQDHDLLRQMKFTEDKKGIRAMVLGNIQTAYFED